MCLHRSSSRLALTPMSLWVRVYIVCSNPPGDPYDTPLDDGPVARIDPLNLRTTSASFYAEDGEVRAAYSRFHTDSALSQSFVSHILSREETLFDSTFSYVVGCEGEIFHVGRARCVLQHSQGLR